MEMPPLVDLSCQEAVERVSDYLAEGDAMGAPARALLEEHLYACPWCMTYLHQVGGVAEAAIQLREIEAPPSASSEAKLLALFRGYAARPGGRVSGVTTRAVARAAESVHNTPLGEPAAAAPRFALKFLERGAVSPIARFRWPEPASDGTQGAWLRANAPLSPCRVGVHTSPRSALARWLHDELWIVELAGDTCRADHALIAASARLVRRVSAWDAAFRQRFMAAAHGHAEASAAARGAQALAAATPHLASSARHIPRGNTALSSYCAAMAAARAFGLTRFSQPAYDAERDFQSAWLSHELGLDAEPELA